MRLLSILLPILFGVVAVIIGISTLVRLQALELWMLWTFLVVACLALGIGFFVVISQS